MTKHLMIGSALMAALFCLPAVAQPGPGMGGMGGGGPGARIASDCPQSANPAACTAQRELRAKAREACQSKIGQERRQCMQEQIEKIDCSTSPDPQQCTARKQAYQACKDQPRSAMRQCMRTKMPAPDCTKAANSQRCDMHQKARAACQDKLGPEHKACLREQFQTK